MINKVIALCFLFLFAAGNLFADTIILKSGKEVECKILEKTSDSVKVDFQGVTLTYLLSDIDKINNEQIVSAVKEVASVTEAIPVPQAVVEEPKFLPASETPIVKESIPVTEIAPVQPSTTGDTQVLPAIENPPVSEEAPIIIPEAPKQDASQNIAPQEPPKTDIVVKPAVDLDKQARVKQLIQKYIVFGLIALFIFIVIMYIYTSLCLYIIAKKTAKEPIWFAWVPIANLFLMCKIGSVSYWWLLGLLAGFITYIGIFFTLPLSIYLLYKIAIARNKPGWVAFLGLIPIAGPFIVWGYLAFKDN